MGLSASFAGCVTHEIPQVEGGEVVLEMHAVVIRRLPSAREVDPRLDWGFGATADAARPCPRLDVWHEMTAGWDHATAAGGGRA